ncbi:MAG: TonB-dependent receptor [Prevotellaceae bacterium]|jgi:TonB-linked SusC/RagA family outer membrane protein|nr:TonB-dependent receptor [Prevotellaceae bacterium]
MKRTAFILCSLFSVLTVFAQTGIRGKVVDSYNEAIIGASVVVKGTTTKGTVTDVDGIYTLFDVNETDVLVFSYIGYTRQEIVVGNQSVIDVILKESSIALEEAVIVGYGQQKKVNLTGAVSTVQIDERISRRSVANTSSALQGLIPGLTVTQSSGMAGNNSATLLIRGLGTINDANPLIVVDDMPDVDINRLNMDDIETISVLKDATASSVYGSRGANGVILIKTKSGKSGNTQITFNSSYSFEKPIRSYSFLSDYAQALEVHRAAQAATNMAESAQQYQKGTVDQWLAMGMIDSQRYPNTDWWDLMMRTGTMQNYNVSATGGNEVSNFYASIGYLKQEGLQINNDYDRYNVRFNFDYKLFNNLTAGLRMDGNWSNFQYVLSNGFTGGTSGNMDIQYAVAGITPYDSAIDAYGSVMAIGEDPTAFNPLEYFNNHKKNKDEQQLNGSFYLNWEPLKGLNARVDYSLRYYNSFLKEADMPNQAYNFQTETYNKWYVSESAGISNTIKNGYKTLLNARLSYHKTFAEVHDLNALFVYSEEFWTDRSLFAYRENRVHPVLTEIDAALMENISNSGTSSSEGLRSYIGRLNYSAFNKYLFELNFRVDGSSKFQPGHQYGFFPSGSFGWRFSEENFIKPYVENWFDSGKFRLSYGGLGNNSVVRRTEQQEILDMNNYVIDGKIVKGFVYNKMLNPELSWEKTSVFNMGMDFVFLNSHLTAELDYYDRLTTGMIQQSQMSIHLTGAYEAPRANLGTLRNRGLEGNFMWRNKIRDFNYSVNFNVSYNASRLEKWAEFLNKGNVYVGMPYQFLYGYLDNGIAQSYAEIYNTTLQWVRPGDILRVDVNGDGVVNGEDQVAYINNLQNMPTTNFGLNLKMDWRGFDLSMLFQGTAGRRDYWITKFNSVNVPQKRYASSEEHVTSPWSYDNRDGVWPRLDLSSGNQASTTFWLDNLSYLRMKNLMFGYTLPKNLTKKFFVDNLRVYYSTENLFTVTSYRGLDPEKTDRGDMYPLVSSHSFGISIGF